MYGMNQGMGYGGSSYGMGGACCHQPIAPVAACGVGGVGGVGAGVGVGIIAIAILILIALGVIF